MVVQMSDRRVLGPADVSDAELIGIVADWLGENPHDVEVLRSSAEVVPYDLDAITTAGRYWVRGEARTRSGVRSVQLLRQARPVLVAVTAVRRDPAGLPRDRRGQRAVADRAADLPIRPGRPAA